MTRIVFISDTHNQLKKLNVPEGQILVHSGDATMGGTVEEISRFNLEFSSLSHPHKLFVSGNHDWLFERSPVLARSILNPDISYLEDSEVEIEGIKIYGSPYQPEFCDWAFNLPRGEKLKAKWDLIPEDTEILVTHGPPKGILDSVRKYTEYSLGAWDRPSKSVWEKVGCRDLLERVKAVKPLIHAFGHIHTQPGTKVENGTLFVNASIGYHVENKPIVVDIVEGKPIVVEYDV